MWWVWFGFGLGNRPGRASGSGLQAFPEALGHGWGTMRTREREGSNCATTGPLLLPEKPCIHLLSMLESQRTFYRDASWESIKVTL